MRHYMSSFMAVYSGTGHSPIRKFVVWFFRNASQWSIFTIGRRGTVYCSLNSIVNPCKKKKQEMFQKHICSLGAKFTIEAKPVEASKHIKWTTHWAQKSGLIWTFEHATWKSIGIIYLLGATPAQSLILIKWRVKKILTGQHTGLKRVVWPWPLNMWLENQ